MDYNEALRIIRRLAICSWVKEIFPIPERWLLVETTDGEHWHIASPLSYTRLLYLYERGYERQTSRE